jgi:hypothetical protein
VGAADEGGQIMITIDGWFGERHAPKGGKAI